MDITFYEAPLVMLLSYYKTGAKNLCHDKAIIKKPMKVDKILKLFWDQ